MLYLASPYSHPDREVMEDRYHAALFTVARLVRVGQIPYCPIVHFHEVARWHKLPTDAAYWSRINVAMLRLADSLYVLRLDGWDQSVGVRAEIEFAEAYGKPIVFLDQEENLYA